MLADDILTIEHIHEIVITEAFRLNQYYHVIGYDKGSKPVEFWVFADDVLEKMGVSHTTHEYLALLGIEYAPNDVLGVTVVNNHVLCIRLSTGVVYYNDQILNTMGDILQFTVSDVYHKQLES